MIAPSNQEEAQNVTSPGDKGPGDEDYWVRLIASGGWTGVKAVTSSFAFEFALETNLISAQHHSHLL